MRKFEGFDRRDECGLGGAAAGSAEEVVKLGHSGSVAPPWNLAARKASRASIATW